MNISVVIPNYNGEELLRENLPKVIDILSSYKDGKVDIVVGDDGSSDHSIAILEKIESDIKSKNITFRIIQNKKNLGFASNIDRAIRESKGEICILLNTDVVPEANFLEPLLSHFKDESIFGVGCMDKSIENGKVFLRGRGIAAWHDGFLIHTRGEVDRRDTFWISGGSSAVRKSLYEKIGGFDPLYNPFYWEDIDLSYRAQKSGYKIVFENKSIVVHEHSKGSIKKHYKNSQIQKIAYRNQFTFIWKNITDRNLIISHIFWLPVHFARAFMRFDAAFFSGFFMAVGKWPDIMNKRERQRKLFVKKDVDVLSQFAK